MLPAMAHDADNIHFKILLAMIPAQHLYSEEIQNTDGEHSNGQTGDSKPLPKKKRQDPLTSQPGSSLQSTLSDRDEKVKGKKESKQKKKKKAKEKTGPSLNIQEAQEKLRARIAELQAKRAQGLSSAELQERKRLERKQRRMNARSKHKNKKKDSSGPDESNAATIQPVLVKTSTKPILTKEGKLVFSKFDFKQSGDKEKSTGLVGKDYKRILARLEQREARVAKMKETDTDAAVQLEQKHVWQNVLSKAKGEKIKDDTSKLKKAIKRKEKIKDQRKKKWDQRQKTVENQQKQKQEKRQQNIQKRKDEKKAKHRKKLIKKGRILPGF